MNFNDEIFWAKKSSDNRA